MTHFEKKVLRQTLKIPFGEVKTYKWIAEKIGAPQSYRAVANVLAKNPYPLLVPCHRVVQSSGKTGGYSLGARSKKELIKLEKNVKNMLK